MKSAMRDGHEILREKILKFMYERDWHHKIAKQRGFEQTLLEHTANCLDILLTLMPILKRRMNLMDEEEQALILGVVTHDVAKERDEWQDYISGKSGHKSHLIPNYTIEAIKILAEWLDFGGQDDARAGANLHMKAVQTAGRIFTETQNAGPRVILLQRLVADVDNVASADGLFAAQDALSRSSLDKYVHSAYHNVHVRGVSTTLLHMAAQTAFEKQGWVPLLLYPTGTIYVRSGAEEPTSITALMVQEELASVIARIFLEKRRILPELVVGNILKNYMPKPDLFDYRMFKDCLKVASTRAGVKAGKKINPDNAHQYANFSKLLKAELAPSLVLKTQKKTGESLKSNIPEEYHHQLVLQPSDIPKAEAVGILNRIGEGQPEMAVFKLLKELVKSGLLDESGLSALRQEYDNLFGSMAFEALTSTSTLMPARDQAFTVDFFWALPLKRLAEFLKRPDLDLNHTVGSLDQKRRVCLLIDTLAKVGDLAFNGMERPPTVDNFARDVAAVFAGDLLAPEVRVTDVQAFAAGQLQYYERAKGTIRTEREVGHICPACNQPFERGTKALDAFIGSTPFTGRKLAYDGEGLVICLACYYERLLRQIILGRKAHDLLVLMPRMSLGRYGGKVFLDKLDEVKRLVKSVATADTIDPDETLRLDLTWFIGRQVLSADFSLMSPEDLMRLFIYRSQDKTVQKNLKEVIKKSQEMLASDDVQEARNWWECDFTDWMEVAHAIASKEVNDSLAQRIRESVYGLRPPIEFVAQTANLVLAPSGNPRVSGKSAWVESGIDSDTKAALKQLLITLAFALGLDCSVAILQDDESLNQIIQETGGAAYVPPVPSVRNLIAHNRSRQGQQMLSPAWLSQAEGVRWLRALASAVLLAQKAAYPPRNDLYQVLTSRSKGALMRRIEQKGGKMFTKDLNQVEAIGEVLS